MEFILYPLFIIIAMLIAAELNATQPAIEPQPKPAAPKAVATAPRMVIPVAKVPAKPVTIEAAPIDWSAWSIRELRWTATRMGVRGAGRMTKAAAQTAILAAIE